MRRLTPDELPKAWELGRRAFGSPRTPPDAWIMEWQSQRAWGVVDSTGRLVAHAVDRWQQHWFGGRLVPATGVTAWLTFPTLALAGVARPKGTELREAVAADVPHLLETYRAVARAGNGLLEREGPLFATEPESVLASQDGITVVGSPKGTLEGYTMWDRGDAGELSVPELIGLTPSATRALLSMLSRWASVTPTLRLRLPDHDPTLLTVDTASARVLSRQPWMLRVVDARAAVAARGWPRQVEGSLGLVLDDDVCPWNTGQYQLVLYGGSGRLEPGRPPQVRLTMRGLALLYAGATTPAVLRRAGLLSGGDEETDEFLLAATAGPPPAILDTF